VLLLTVRVWPQVLDALNSKKPAFAMHALRLMLLLHCLVDVVWSKDQHAPLCLRMVLLLATLLPNPLQG
jgi:hypothetical protein